MVNKSDDHKTFCNWGLALAKWGDLGGPDAEKHYREACEKFQRATEIKLDEHKAFNSWGLALEKWADIGGSEAENRYQLACEKYQKAIEIDPMAYEVFDNCGVAFLSWAQLKDGQEREKLYQEAEEILLRAEAIKRGEGAYNLGCLFALRNNEEKCKYWLKVGEEAKTLPTREEAMKDEDLASVRDKDWFKAIRWKGE